ncbi:methyltransferase [Microbispora sp. ATCC PTA-5024]|uniref:methyltransferase n=1 Tax=Microbispora sp. ATCC PTA-5024 TaxID=316330 RepID=UPI000422449A|nr:methyltransferase [Microbispora sp. ATCC PTA-5024]
MTEPSTVVWDILRGGWRLAALSAIVELDCAGHLKDGPLTVDELAGRCGAHPGSLARVLRTGASCGLFATVSPGTYALTDAGALLVGGVPGSLRSAVQANTAPTLSYGMDNLATTVRQGRSAFVEKYGVLYDHLSTDPELNGVFNDFMTSRSGPMAEGVAGRYDFSQVKTLVDLGGGRGHILAAALRANPHLRGVLFELGHVLPDARAAMEGWGLLDRVDFVEGDFFRAVPAGYDAYLLGSVIHNWDDEDASTILRVVREAMSDDGRVLLVEIVLPDDDTPHFGKEIDMRMLGLFGQGRERSGSEHAALLEGAGLRLSGTTPLPFHATLIEAVPA